MQIEKQIYKKATHMHGRKKQLTKYRTLGNEINTDLVVYRRIMDNVL